MPHELLQCRNPHVFIRFVRAEGVSQRVNANLFPDTCSGLISYAARLANNAPGGLELTDTIGALALTLTNNELTFGDHSLKTAGAKRAHASRPLWGASAPSVSPRETGRLPARRPSLASAGITLPEGRDAEVGHGIFRVRDEALERSHLGICHILHSQHDPLLSLCQWRDRVLQFISIENHHCAWIRGEL
jgi:hypothetical protein